MNKLPWEFTADRLMPIEYYRYTSSVIDRVVDLNTHNRQNDPELQKEITPFQAIKNKCLATPLDISDAQDGSEYHTDIWDNKVVICCLTDSGNRIYIGQYDGNWTMGLGVRSDSWIKPYKYKHANYDFRNGVAYDMDYWTCKCKHGIHHSSDSICVDCGEQEAMQEICTAPKAYYVKNNQNMYKPSGKYIGIHTKESLMGVVKKAYETCYKGADLNDVISYHETWLKQDDHFAKKFLLEIALQISSKVRTDKNLYNWIINKLA